MLKNINESVQLSKWWRTDSCKRAFDRAAQRRTERITALKEKLNARKAELNAQIWEGVSQ